MTTAQIDTIDALETLPVKIDYVGETIRDNDWKCDQWRVKITTKAGLWATDYFTGLGHRSKIPAIHLSHNPPRRGTLAYENLEKAYCKPVTPKIASVLHSLLLDASAANENFHDWCANYGFSDDSIKAMNTYKQCLETATYLRKHFSPDTLRQMRELLQNY